MKYIMCSRHFPKGHPKAGEETWFVEKILSVILRSEGRKLDLDNINPAIRPLVNDFFIMDGECNKHHTIRAGSRWKVGDMVSLRVWSDKPYRSKQIEFAQVEVKKVWSIEISYFWWVGYNILEHEEVVALAKNDGLAYDDFIAWFAMHPKKKDEVFKGQIICWSDAIEYKP